jgi:hypothetical protein
LYKIPTLNVPIQRDMVQILSPMVGFYEIAVLKAVHGNRVLEEQITPAGEFISVAPDDAPSEGYMTVSEEHNRMMTLYGKHPEQARYFVDIAYPNGFEQFAKALVDAANAGKAKAK